MDILQSSLILFTSTGLWGLTINARYSHAAGVLRDFHEHGADRLAEDLLISRCRKLKRSFLFLIGSVLIGILYAVIAILGFYEIALKALMLTYCLLLFASMTFLFFDVMASLNATLLRVDVNKRSIDPDLGIFLSK